MKIRFVLLFSAFSLALLSQEIDSSLYEKTWMDKETRIYNGFPVTKIFGQLPHMPRAYNILPITAVSYQSYEQLKDKIEKEAVEAHFSEEEITSNLNDLEKKAKGGEIQIYISRYEEDEANFKWFFVILRGKDDKGKLWEHEIGYQAPQNPYERGWWNYTTVKVPVELNPPFYIYLNDKHSKYLSDFKFEVGLP
jgi:hypothetical protein